MTPCFFRSWGRGGGLDSMRCSVRHTQHLPLSCAVSCPLLNRAVVAFEGSCSLLGTFCGCLCSFTSGMSGGTCGCARCPGPWLPLRSSFLAWTLASLSTATTTTAGVLCCVVCVVVVVVVVCGVCVCYVLCYLCRCMCLKRFTETCCGHHPLWRTPSTCKQR